MPQAYRELLFFYQKPDLSRVPALLGDVDGLMKNRPDGLLVGFMAGLIVKYPDLKDFLPQAASQDLQRELALAYKLAGRPEQAQALRRQFNLDDMDLHAHQTLTSLDALPLASPEELQSLLGAGYATGDPRYVRRIYERYAALANRPELSDDIAAIARALPARVEMRPFVEKHGFQALFDLSVAAIALFYLVQGWNEHPFIRTALQDRIFLNGAGQGADPAGQIFIAYMRERR